MLPRQHRLNRSADLRNCFRKGRRFGVSGGSISILQTSSTDLSRVGLVTPKLVGNSVVRHFVARRIRAAAANVLQLHPYGLDIAVRAVEKSAENQVNYWESEILQAIERLNKQSPKSGLRNE